MENGFENIEVKDDRVVVSVNPKIYSLEVIQSAAYVFLDKVYVIVDGDPESEIFVELRPKENTDLEKLGLEFNNELVNYAVYDIQSKRNKEVRDAIVNRVFLSHDGSYFPEEDQPQKVQQQCDCKSELTDDEKELLKDDNIIGFEDDPLGIAEPWTPEKAKGLEEPDKNE